MYLLVLKYYICAVCIPASKERPQKNRRETTVRRVRAPMYVCVCCVCVRACLCVCVRASRVLKILLLLLLSSLLGLEGSTYTVVANSRCRKDIYRYCARPEQPSVTSSPRRATLKEKKTVIIFI